MKKHSLMNHMLTVLFIGIAIIFVTLLLAFNLLLQGFMRKESVKDLKDSLTQVQQVIQKDFPGLDTLGKNRPALTQLANRLEETIKNRLILSQQKLIISDGDFNLLYLNNTAPSPQSDKLAEKILGELRHEKPVKNKPIKISFNNKTFYAAYMPIKAMGKDKVNLVFYTDTTDLSNFARNINRVLITASFLSAFIALVLGYLMASGTVSSIKKLGGFAKAIGKGDFTKRSMNFRELELDELCEDMNITAQRLLEQDNQQKIFFQNVSHELKTPLMSIQGYAEGVKYGVIEDKVKACDVIIDECKRLSEMVNDLILISRLENKTENLKMAHSDLKVILSDCVQRVYGLAVSKKKEIKLNLPDHSIPYNSDEEKLSRAILNLAANSLRHAKNTIEVSLALDKANALITLIDDGDGFEEKDLPHLFERFYKGKNGQTGLGLTIAKSIIEAHHGTIEASNCSRGALFTIVLPL